MRIFMLVPFPGVAGPVGKHTPLLVNGLRGLGCEVVTEPWGRHADKESLRKKAAGRAADIIRIRRRAARGDFDVMVVKTSHEWPSLIRDVPLLAATHNLVPAVVLQFHGGRSDRLVSSGQIAFKSASAVLFRLMDGALVLSSEERRDSQHFWPQGRFYVVTNPFSVPAHAALHRPKATGGAGRPPTILFASRLIVEKGIFDTLSALAELRPRLRARLVIAGRGPQTIENAIAKRIEQLELGDDVTFAGYLDSDRLAQVYHGADVFVLPTYWIEGFPTVLSEAMAAGLPIITTRTRGIADHLVDGVHALFVPPRDPRALATALERLLRDPELRERMSRTNRTKVRDFAPEKVARQYLGTLEKIVRG